MIPSNLYTDIYLEICAAPWAVCGMLASFYGKAQGSTAFGTGAVTPFAYVLDAKPKCFEKLLYLLRYFKINLVFAPSCGYVFGEKPEILIKRHTDYNRVKNDAV